MSKLATCKDCRTKIGKAFFQLVDFKYNGIKQLLHFNFAEFISSRLKYLCTSNYTRPWYNSYFILRWAESEPNLLNTCEISNIFSLLFFLNDKELIETLEEWENIKSYMEYRNSNPINYGLFSLDCPIILYPEISFIKNTKKPYISAPYYYRINLTEYFKKYFTEDIRKEQIERIRIVLDENCR